MKLQIIFRKTKVGRGRAEGAPKCGRQCETLSKPGMASTDTSCELCAVCCCVQRGMRHPGPLHAVVKHSVRGGSGPSPTLCNTNTPGTHASLSWHCGVVSHCPIFYEEPCLATPDPQVHTVPILDAKHSRTVLLQANNWRYYRQLPDPCGSVVPCSAVLPFVFATGTPRTEVLSSLQWINFTRDLNGAGKRGCLGRLNGIRKQGLRHISDRISKLDGWLTPTWLQPRWQLQGRGGTTLQKLW